MLSSWPTDYMTKFRCTRGDRESARQLIMESVECGHNKVKEITVANSEIFNSQMGIFLHREREFWEKKSATI